MPAEHDPGGPIACGTTGSGPPLVLIHGVGTNRTIWQLSLPLLGERRSITTLDLPGFGQSEPPPEWSLEVVADLIAETLAERIEGRFDLIGSSLGGAVALTIADRHPALLKRLILAAPAGFRPVPGPLPALLSAAVGPMLSLRRSAGLRLSGNGHARRALLAGTVADGAALDPEAARLILRASEGAESLGPAFRAAASADLRELATRIETPLGLVWGTEDRLIAAHTVERILEIHPEIPVELITGAGHIPHLEKPEKFSAAVERVFSQLP